MDSERPVPEGLIDEHRHIHIMDDAEWHELVVTDWVERMEEQGVTVQRGWNNAPKVYWDHYFNIQVDAYVGIYGWEEIIGAYEDFDEFPFFVALVKAGGGGTFSYDTTGTYLEKGFDGLDFIEAGMDDDDPAYQILQPGLDAEAPRVEAALESIFETALGDLKDDLEREYEYLTSDEHIADFIREQYPEWIDAWEEKHEQEAA